MYCHQFFGPARKLRLREGQDDTDVNDPAGIWNSSPHPCLPWQRRTAVGWEDDRYALLGCCWGERKRKIQQVSEQGAEKFAGMDSQGQNVLEHLAHAVRKDRVVRRL